MVLTKTRIKIPAIKAKGIIKRTERTLAKRAKVRSWESKYKQGQQKSVENRYVVSRINNSKYQKIEYS